MNTEVRELNAAELDAVSGGQWRNAYKECASGTTAGGNPGLYPKTATCNPSPAYGSDNLANDMAGAMGGAVLGVRL